MNKFISHETKLDFNDVLIVPKPSSLSSRSEVNMVSKLAKDSLGIETNGIIAANMDGVGTFNVAKILKNHGCMTSLTKHYDVDSLLQFFETDDASHAWYTMGANNADLEKFHTFFNSYRMTDNLANAPLKVAIDAANAYQTSFVSFCKEFKERYPAVITMAGNVVEYNGYYMLKQFVDIVKVGIGGGQQCRTRTQTGIGYPQLSAILDIGNAMQVAPTISTASSLCSDGGCTTPGDVSKALAAGAGYVMIGTMLAGTTEGGGTIIDIDGKQYVEFYGMSSKTAQNKHNGGLRDYRASEGRTVLLPYKGSMDNVIKDILGGIRSTCTYVGATDINDLTYKSQFIHVNNVINKSMEQYTTGH